MPEKSASAPPERLERLWDDQTGRVSVRVLQEFYVTEIAELSQLSFWDGLIVASAEQAGAAQLYTEDLNAGQTIVGVKIVNPLVAA